MKRHTPRNIYQKLTTAQTSLMETRNNPVSSFREEQQFYQLLLQLATFVAKESSNNVALVVIAAMFFGFAVLITKPAISPVDSPQINLQGKPTMTVKE